MFTPQERDALQVRLIAFATRNPRIAAAAAVGSTAAGSDRWSDLDLTFAVAEGATVAEALAEWTEHLRTEHGAALLFDLSVAPTIYRVFLLPGALQVDLSFTPAADFAPRGPRFRLLFGEAGPDASTPATPPSPAFELGLAVHHLVRTRICIERGRLWQADYWLREARNHALTLACLRHDLDPTHGRGFDRLPAAPLEALAASFPRELQAAELLRALAIVTSAVLAEAGHIPDADPRIPEMVSGMEDTA